MSLNEYVLIATTLLAVGTSIAAIVKERRKPELDQANANASLVSAEQIKAEIKKQSEQSNNRRDLRILDLEQWADMMRPWASRAKERDDLMWELIKEDRTRMGLDMPFIPALPPVPPFPPPRAF